jgi:hypothetical protein
MRRVDGLELGAVGQLDAVYASLYKYSVHQCSSSASSGYRERFCDDETELAIDGEYT